MEKKGFNAEDIIHVIENWTDDEVARALTAQENLLNRKLLPELKKEMAVKQLQEKEIRRMQDEHDVRNLAAKFVLSIKGGFFEDAYRCFALNTEDVWANVEKYGVYAGAQKLYEYFVDYYKKIGGGEGCFIIHELTTPVIELTDETHAQAMFITEGILAIDPSGAMKAEETARSLWQFGPWAMDCVKEEDVWKIWHLTMYDDVETTYERSWSELASHDAIMDANAPRPTRPTKDYHYFTPDRKPYLHQEPPCKAM